MNDGFGPYLVHALIVLVLVGSSVIAMARGRIGATLQNALIWIVLFGALIIGYSYRDVLMAEFSPGMARQIAVGEVELTRRSDGHFYATLALNGTDVTFFVDTGASDVVLSQADARRVGIDPEALRYSGRALTANGAVRTASVRLEEVRLGDIVDRGVPASITDGALGTSLLGMAYLERFDRIEIQGNRMRLIR